MVVFWFMTVFVAAGVILICTFTLREWRFGGSGGRKVLRCEGSVREGLFCGERRTVSRKTEVGGEGEDGGSAL